MKKITLSKILIAISLILMNLACDNRDLITVENIEAPKILDLSSETLVLDSNFPKNPALVVTWEAAKYTAPTEVYYRLETSAMQTFENSVELSVLDKSITNVTFTTEQINAAAATIGLPVGVSSTMYLRVVAYLGNKAVSAVSNTTSLKVTPYVLSYPDFYIVGAASYVGWNAGSAQLLYKKDNLSYIYSYLESGQPFRFLGQQDWNPTNYSIDQDGTNTPYRYFKQVPSTIAQDGVENMKFSGATGIYKILIDATVGVQSLAITASPIPTFDIPQLYIVGNIAGNNWSETNAIAMTKISAGVFEFTTTLPNDSAFKILGQQSWGALDWGNISADGDSGFLGPKGDNGNINFVGDGSSYTITVNVKAGTYKIVK